LGGSDALRARPPSEPLRGSWFFEKMSCAICVWLDYPARTNVPL
jgi:hypothetical protein